MYTPKPRPKLTDDICVKHNRRLRDYEMINGCIECAREEKAATVGKSTTVHVLAPETKFFVIDENAERSKRYLQAVINLPKFYCTDYSNCEISVFDHCEKQCDKCVKLVAKHQDRTKALGL